MDNISFEKRSWNMSRIKSKDTSIEKKVRSYLHKRGLRFSLHNKNLPGKPDLYFKKYNTAVFINGCFWHRHEGCKKSTFPKTNVDYWNNKFQKNIYRDLKNYKMLSSIGIKVFVIWECQISDLENLNNLYNNIINNNKV